MQKEKEYNNFFIIILKVRWTYIMFVKKIKEYKIYFLDKMNIDNVFKNKNYLEYFCLGKK